MGALVLVVLVLVACEPLPPTVEIRDLPTDTPTSPTEALKPTLTPPLETGTLAPLWTSVPISPTQVIQEETVVFSSMIPTPSNPALQKLVAQAKDDLARRLAIEADQIDVIEAKAVVWSDSSLGCPQPGMAYTQIPQDGLLIRLRAGKRLYHYHSGGRRSPFLCEQSTTDDSLVAPPGLGNQ